MLSDVDSDSDVQVDEDEEDCLPEIIPDEIIADELICDNQIDTMEFNDSDSDSDGSIEDNEVGCFSSDDNFFITKDGTKWYKNPPSLQRQSAHNIFRDTNSWERIQQLKISPKIYFFCIMSSNILDIICLNTNIRAERDYNDWNSKNPDKRHLIWDSLDNDELSAYLGILLVIGIHRSNYEEVNELWKTNAFPLYQAAMSVKRFKNISRFIRFDSYTTRSYRKTTDKAAPIREEFE